METAAARSVPQAAGAAAPLRVYLLGRFEVERGEAAIPSSAWRRRRPADLLQLLALSPGRALGRERLVETLWPGREHLLGANNLHRALYDLRQVLEGRFVGVADGVVRLRADAWVDVDAFEAAAREPEGAALDAAVSLYRGDLVPGGDAPWLEAPRGRLRALFAAAACSLSSAAAARGEPAVAIPLVRRALEADPAHQGAHALLVRLLAEAGRCADALRQLSLCEAALRDRGASPGPELRALRGAVQRGALGPAPSSVARDGFGRAARRLLGTPEPPPLRGRASALLLLEALVASRSGAIVLLGERGVGKTRLAVEGARIAQAAGATVLAGVLGAARAAPFAGFADAFAEHARAGGGGFDPFAELPSARLGAEAEKARLFGAVRRALADAGGGRPVYLLLDDVDRADESSANLFHLLAREAAALRLMLVATCREDAVRAGAPVQLLLAHLDCGRLARGVRVQRLDLPATRAQLADVLGAAPPDALAAQVYRATDGNPSCTEELGRALRESGHLRVPQDPAEVVRERLARVGPGAASLLQAAAVAGRRFDLAVATAASGLAPEDAAAALDGCIEAGLLAGAGPAYHFHHDLVREAVYGSLPQARRASLHRAVAEAIALRAGPAGGGEAAPELAHHREAGGQPGRAFGHLVAAGHHAAARAGLAEASELYERALELADAAGASPGDRLELAEALGAARLDLGELAGAIAAFDGAVALAQGAGPNAGRRARSLRGAALALAVAGRAEAARHRLDAALADLPRGSGDDRAEVLQLSAQLAWHAGRPRDALDLALACAEEARRSGEGALAGRGDDMAALARASLREPAGAADVAPSERGLEAPFEVHLVLWENDLLGARPPHELEADVAAFRERATRRDAPASVAIACAVEGALAGRAARWESAEASLREAADRFRRAGSAFGEAFAHDRLAEALTARGRVEEALTLLGDGILVAERAALRRHALLRLHATLARNRLAAGALYAAEDALREASALAARHGECAVCSALFYPELVRLHLARGRIAEAAAGAADLEALAARHGGRGLGAAACASRGRVLLAEGRAEEGRAVLLAAVRLHDDGGARYEAARCAALAADGAEALLHLGATEPL